VTGAWAKHSTFLLVEAVQLTVCETGDVAIGEEVIHTAAAPVCSFGVSLVSGDLNMSGQ